MTTPDASPRKNVWKAFIPVAVILALVVGGLYAVKLTVKEQGGGPTQEVAVGSVLPDLELQKFQGATTTLSKLPGKVTVINFWATWCDACMVEMPSLIKLYDAYKSKGLDVAAVNLDDEPAQVVPEAVRKLGISFPVYRDANEQAVKIFDVHAIPLTVVIDRSRRILLLENGERDWNGSDIRAKMDEWLKP